MYHQCCKLLIPNGGEGGIRTHGTREGSTVFETARFNRSRTSPRRDTLSFPYDTSRVTMAPVCILSPIGIACRPALVYYNQSSDDPSLIRVARAVYFYGFRVFLV